MKNPKVTFHFSLEVNAVYALEMTLQAHAIKMEIQNLPIFFDRAFLQRCREELSLGGFFWHLRSLTAAENLDVGLKKWVESEIHPLLEEGVKRYEQHWREIVHTLKENATPLVEEWNEYGQKILQGINFVSRFPWVHEEIKVFFLEPICDGHGDAFLEEGVVTFEAVEKIRQKPKKALLGLIHEIAHLNTAKIIDQLDIRRKVLAEVVNDFVAHQSLVTAGVMPALDSERLHRIFTHTINQWMTESEESFTYDPQKLRQLVEEWWSEHLESNVVLNDSINKLFRKALPIMRTIKKPSFKPNPPHFLPKIP